MANVFRKSEISLFDTFYPIIGPVRPLVVSQWAPKQVIGDYTKDSETIASTYTISDHRGGIGMEHMKEGRDDDRSRWSTCQLDYEGHLLLPVKVTNCGNPTGADPAVLKEYANEMYGAFGADVRKRNEGTQAWGSSLVTLNGTPTDVIVHKSKVYFAGGTDFDRFDGTTWTDGATLGSAQPCRYFVEWDSKLFTLDNDGQLDYSIDEGVTWTTSALSPLPSGYFTSLFLCRDAAGDVVIHLGTKQGVYTLDFVNAKWIETDIELPYHDYACKGATRWREATYIPSGMAVHRYEAAARAITLMGLDRDYGLPGDYTGAIVRLLSGHNFLYAMVDATSAPTRDLYLCGAYGDVVFYENEGYSAVMKWGGKGYYENASGWSVVALGGAAATPLTAATIASADDIYRLWYALDGNVYYIPLQLNILNPLQVADFEFGLTGEHITPWFDKDNAVVDALAILLTAYATETSSTEYIKVYYGTDYDDDTWTLFTNTDFADGQIDSDGEAAFTFASGAGLAFKAIRFKVEGASGSDRLSPDLRWLRLSYIKLLDVKWGFSVRVDCSRNYRHKSARSLLAALKTALETQTLGEFTWKNGNGSETHRVRIAQMQGVEIGGKRSEGIFDLEIVAP